MVREVFREAVDEGVGRLHRSFPALLSTGTVGGLDVGVGVFALFLVLHQTGGNLLLGGIAFSVGFVILTLAGSELFTENFFVPVATVVAGRSTWWAVARLWAGTLVFNLVGGWIVMAIVMSAFPDLAGTAVDTGQHYLEIGIGWRSFALAMLAGMIITLMTWMEQVGSPGTRVVGAVIAGSLLAVGELNHSIVGSLELFAGLIAGAPYGYLDWFTVFAWATLGNVVGGIGLVTVLRLVQAEAKEPESSAEQATEGQG